MIRIALGYVALVSLCALLILLNPLDFLGQGGRQKQEATVPVVQASPAVPDMTPDELPPDSAPELARHLPTPLPQPGVAESTVATTTAAILADLLAAQGAPGPAPSAEAEALRRMSAAVLADLGVAEVASPPATLETLVARALAAGQSDAAIDAMVNQAVAEGTITAPAGLRTAEGKVDTAVLLASILSAVQGEGLGQGDLSDPSATVESGTALMQLEGEDLLYVVAPGDSLGALALRFYGDADQFGTIFKANRQVLDTPDSLRPGIKLLIPARAGL